MSTISFAVQAKAIEIGKLAVRATTAAGSGHPDDRAVARASGGGADVSRHALGSPTPARARRGPAGAVRRPCRADHLCRLRRSRRDVPARRASQAR